MNMVDTARRFVWVLLAMLVVVGLACVYVPVTRHLSELQRKKMALREENVRLQEIIGELRLKQKRFQTEQAFIERTARETGRVKANETVFKFEN